MSHADVDFLGELRVSALLGFLEQSAVEASARGGFDPARYAAIGKVWLVRRTRLQRLLPVGGGDSLRVATHIADFRRARSLRRYEIYLTDGFGKRARGRAAEATTDWVLCDTESRRPVSVPREMQEALLGAASVESRPRAKKVSVPDSVPDSRLSHRVFASHLDHMRHVNNAVWFSFLEDAALSLFEEHGLSVSQMHDMGGGLGVDFLDIEYLDTAEIGDELVVNSWLDNTASGFDDPRRARRLVQTILDRRGRCLLRSATRWRWRDTSAVLGGIPRWQPETLEGS